MAEDPATGQRLDRIERAMVDFNRRQKEDVALSREMRLDFLQEFRAVRKALFIAAAVLVLATVAASFL